MDIVDESKDNDETTKDEGIPTWIYGAVGGAVAAVGITITSFFAWRSRKIRIEESKALNAQFRQQELDREVERMRASTPRENTSEK
jgi:hypothetical protein